MFETLIETTGWDITPKLASVFLALVIGLAFGVLAQITKFCFRSALIGENKTSSMAIWLTALIFAIAGTQLAVFAGLISFEGHRLLTGELPIVAILAGGLMFGAGMVLTRGCASRLTVLAGTGNLRAMFVMIVFAIAAHATLKGVFAPIRTTLGSVTIDLGSATGFSALPGGAAFWSFALILAALTYIIRAGSVPKGLLFAAALLGLLVPAAWVGTGFILFDEFDPIALESLSFTAPMAESLFWSVASSSIPAGFGTGLIGGVLLGALAASLTLGSFQWQSFETPSQTGRYLAGAVLMGIGGVLAGGCTVGAGLAGIPTLSFAALLALVAIAAGALAMNAVLNRGSFSVSGAQTPIQSGQPAL